MPQNTTLDAVQSLVISTVRGVTPTITRDSVGGWEPRPSNRPARSGLRNRSYSVELYGDRDAPAEVAGWTCLSEVREVTCHVVTDYSIPFQDAYPIIAQDNADLRDALSDLKKTSSNGIWWVQGEEFTDPPEPEEGGDHYQVEHEFTIRYQRARSY